MPIGRAGGISDRMSSAELKLTGLPRKALLAGVTLVVALAAQELAVRLALPSYNPANHLRFEVNDPTLPPLGQPLTEHQLVKNSGDYSVHVAFNRFGLRDDRDISLARSDDYVVVGDSFAFGWGVEETQRLSERLETRSSRKVYNLAIPAGIKGYEKLLDYAEAQGAQIENVILALNMGDDIVIDVADNVGMPQPALAKPDTAPAVLPVIKEFLLTNSALYFSVTSVIHRSDFLKRLLIELGLVVDVARVTRTGPDAEAIADTVARLQALSHRFKNFTVLLIAQRSLWSGGEIQETARRNHADFVTALKESAVDFIDTKPLIESESATPLVYYFDNDAHWRASGHDLAATALAKHLAATGG